MARWRGESKTKNFVRGAFLPPGNALDYRMKSKPLLDSNQEGDRA